MSAEKMIVATLMGLASVDGLAHATEIAHREVQSFPRFADWHKDESDFDLMWHAPAEIATAA